MSKKLQTRDQKRIRFFQQSKLNPSHSRYGLFSYAGTLAISKFGDRQKPSRRDIDGSVKLGPRNFTTTPVKRGKTPDAYFSSHQHSPEPFRDRKPSQRASHQKIRQIHGMPFKSTNKGGLFNQIEYFSYNQLPKVRKRDTDGSVILAPRNFYVSPSKTPQVFQHLSDPYERKQLMARKRLMEEKEKEGQKPFKSASKGGNLFTENEELYADFQIQNSKKKVQNKPQPVAERPFYPSSNTKTSKYDASFQKFPEYKEQKQQAKKRMTPDPRVPFVSGGVSGSSPAPSVAFLNKNLKKDFPRLKF